jgi:hypothetical protein
MSNWFENHPVKSIISFSIALIAATAAVFYFILFENQSNLHLTEKENLKTQIQTLNERISLLQYDNGKYVSENEKLREWLRLTPGTLEFLERRINLLERVEMSSDTSTSNEKTEFSYFSKSPMLYKGTAFLDLKTGLSFGINKISSDRTGSGIITYPDGTEMKFENEKAGKQWEYSFEGVKYYLILMEINFIGDQFRVAIRKE